MNRGLVVVRRMKAISSESISILEQVTPIHDLSHSPQS